MGSYVLALDQGTTSSRAVLFDRAGSPIAHVGREYPQYYPAPGWVEHDPEEIWQSQLQTAQQTLSEAGIPLEEISAIGITNQRETTVLWDRATGQPGPQRYRLAGSTYGAAMRRTARRRAWRGMCATIQDW